MKAPSLHIHHLDIQYKFAKSMGDSIALQRRLDLVAGELLAHAWENHLIQTQEYDESLVFIERVDAEMMINSSANDNERVANAWAHAVHHGIVQTLNRDENVTIFRNRTEFLASFLGELLHGRAWKKWYYRELEPLKPLSLHQAITQLLLENADLSHEILFELARQGHLDLLLAILQDAEIEKVVSQCLLSSGSGATLPNMYAAWTQSLRAFLSGHGFVPTFMPARDTARLYLAILRERPGLGPDAGFARFIHDLFRLRQRGDAQQFLTVLLGEVPGPEAMELLRSLHVESSPAVVRRVSTRYGGLFLLIPAMAEMKLYDFFQHCAYPEPAGMTKSAFLLFLVALQCLGRRHLEPAQRDKGPTLFAGLSTSPAFSQLQQYAATLKAEQHKIFLTSFQTHLQEVTKPVANIYPRLRNLNPETAGNRMDFLISEPSEPPSPMQHWEAALAQVSATVLHWFAATLGAFADSSPDYLRRNFLESQANIDVFTDRIVVRFLTCPLQMVLRMIGFDHNTWEVPWLENKKLEFQFD